MFEKNGLRNIWFSAYLFNQIQMQTFLEISGNFYNDWIWRDSMSVQLLASQMAILATLLGIHYFSSSF